MGSNGQVSSIHGKAPSLRTSRTSHTIGKGNPPGDGDWPKSQRPPVIRVVHIFNPTVIKTDAANFRSLVQKLTGRNYKPRKLLHPSSIIRSHKKAASTIQVEDLRSGLKPPIFEAQLPIKDATKDFEQNQFVGCYSFADPTLNIPFFESSDSENDQRASIFELSHANMGDDHSCMNINSCEAVKMYIPERLGIFNDSDIVTGLESPEPLPADCTTCMLPPLSGTLATDQGVLLDPMQRFSTFFNTLESFSCK